MGLGSAGVRPLPEAQGPWEEVRCPWARCSLLRASRVWGEEFCPLFRGLGSDTQDLAPKILQTCKLEQDLANLQTWARTKISQTCKLVVKFRGSQILYDTCPKYRILLHIVSDTPLKYQILSHSIRYYHHSIRYYQHSIRYYHHSIGYYEIL